MNAPVTLALVGIGGYGDFYLNEILATKPERAARLVAAIDPQPERSQRLDELRKRGISLFSDLAAFYAQSTADLVIISAPIHLHEPLTCLALSHGSNVLCEKPLAATIQEAVRMAEDEKKSGRRVSIGYQWSFSPAIQTLKGDIMRGDFGRPIRLKTAVLWPRMKSYYGRSPWAGALKSGNGRWVLDSPVNNATAHYLHNMFYVLGSTRETSARPREVTAELYRANPIENYDTAALRCLTDSGAEILFFSAHAVPSGIGPIFRYEFEKAVVSYDIAKPQHIIAQLHDGGTREYGDPSAEVSNKLWQSVESARTGAPTACGVEAATAHTLCVNGAQESVPAITTFPSDLVKTTEDAEAKDRLTWVEGLKESLIQCYDRGVLPSELGSLPWARAGRSVDLRDYRFFPGGKPA